MSGTDDLVTESEGSSWVGFCPFIFPATACLHLSPLLRDNRKLVASPEQKAVFPKHQSAGILILISQLPTMRNGFLLCVSGLVGSVLLVQEEWTKTSALA